MFKLKEFYQYKRELLRTNKVFRYKILETVKGVPGRYGDKSLSFLSLGQGILSVKSSQNNTIIMLSDLKGKVRVVKSCGCLGFHGRKKRSTKFAIESVLFLVLQKAKDLGWLKLAVYLNGFSKGRFYVLNCLKKSGLKLSLFRDCTPIPHNGCRPRKLRRG